MPAAYDYQKVLIKGEGIWNQNEVGAVIKRYWQLLPDAKLLMIVRDPIYRYVSDIVQFNTNRAVTLNITPIQDLDAVVQGRVKTGHHFETISKKYTGCSQKHYFWPPCSNCILYFKYTCSSRFICS